MPSARAQQDSDPWFGRDKALHFAASASIAVVVYAGASFQTESRAKRIVAAASVALAAGLAKGCRAVAYSYIGPELTMPIYRSRTIGKAKVDLEARTAALSTALRERVGGGAWVSVNKALVTQASAAIPVVPLYISALYKVMKEAGTHEGTAEQIARLLRDHLGPGRTPTTDAAGRIRIDDWEMDPAVQARVSALWETVTSETLMTAIDYAGFKHDFRVLFGFEVPGVNYAEPVETEVPIVD
jgi:enoyl-[acyl-carrier protein] reductase/trans-2-enoyl-CoA reductase (NAD+)